MGWAAEVATAFPDIAMVVELQPLAGTAPETRWICLVMRDGEQVPWVAEGKGIEGLTWAAVPGKDLRPALLADPRLGRPGLRLLMNFCDARALMFDYHDGTERVAGEEVLDCRYRILHPGRDRVPRLDEFFYLWGDPAGG
jgi:hypothetical protein